MGILLNVHDVEVVFQLWLVCIWIFFILLWSLAVIQVTFPDRCWFKILFFASSHGVLPCTFALTISQRLAKALHKFPCRFLDLLFSYFLPFWYLVWQITSPWYLQMPPSASTDQQSFFAPTLCTTPTYDGSSSYRFC